MVLALGDLDLFVGPEQPPDLLERLGRHDEIGLRRAAGRRRRDVHPGQPVAVGGHHPHPLGPELPEHAVQDRPALLGAGGEGHVRDQLLQVLGRRAPAAVELDRRERRELLARQAQQPELGAAALDRHPLLAGGGEPDGGAGKLADDLDQLARRQRDRALLVHRGRHRRCSRRCRGRFPRGECRPSSPRGGCWTGSAASSWPARWPPRRRAFLELLPRDRELHAAPRGGKSSTALTSLIILSSSSRGSGYVGGPRNAYRAVRSYCPRRVSTRCWRWGRSTLPLHRRPEFPQRKSSRGDYSAHNSWRA